jgi:TPP-dependent pyruvate/acetoin dehydrogenase alpha subunit
VSKSSTELELFEKMFLIRTFEETIQSLFQKGEIVGTTHLYSGQEAVAVGFASALQPQDLVAATYRGHGHALATGVATQALMDEMLGRVTGVCGGR